MQQNVNLAGLLHNQIGSMTADELKRFRLELARRLPDLVQAAAEAARVSAGKEKGSTQR